MNGNVDQDHFNIQDQGKDKLLEKWFMSVIYLFHLY